MADEIKVGEEVTPVVETPVVETPVVETPEVADEEEEVTPEATV